MVRLKHRKREFGTLSAKLSFSLFYKFIGKVYRSNLLLRFSYSMAFLGQTFLHIPQEI
jgi:hypothetical protein